jgi:phenylalanyl-tRNA synthetase alpha chain
MAIEWTSSQKQRLRELGGTPDVIKRFETSEERDEAFAVEVAHHQAANRKEIRYVQKRPERDRLAHLEEVLAHALISNGFLEVRTPTIISSRALSKMGIDDSHPLHHQVFWLDEGRCLRPMLAPNLYFLMRHLKRTAKMPLRMFEIGTCYRKESRGSDHLEEFTMLNLVEMAPEGDPMTCLRAHIDLIMRTVGLDYELCTTDSEVYGDTLDVEVNGIEVASAACGPHRLDGAHGITDAWVGAGYGLERLLMVKTGASNIKKVGRSLMYLRGARLDI